VQALSVADERLFYGNKRWRPAWKTLLNFRLSELSMMYDIGPQSTVG